MTRMEERPGLAVVRWAWVVVLTALTVIGVLLGPATGLLTLPFSLTTGGLALWLARGGPEAKPDRLATVLVAIGMAGMLFLLVAIVAS